jgi:hypothetical protein
MPVYQYKGQHYSIDDTDVNVAKSKILAYINAQEKIPVDKEYKSVLEGTTLPAAEPVEAAPSPFAPKARSIKEIAAGPDLSEVPKFDVTKMPTAEERAKAEYGYAPEMGNLETAARFAKRIPGQVGRGLAQGYLGIDRFALDMMGKDSSEITSSLNQLAKQQRAIGESENYALKITEGAINSIGQQLPLILGGAATGSMALPLAGMFQQSFGQTYDESRRAGLDVTDSTGRAAAFGAFEVIGEKFGLGNLLDGIKAAAKGVPTKELAGYFAKSLVKQVPGEQLTYAGQFAVDKGYGMNPEAGVKEFIQGAVDTLASTVVQGGIMLGGGAGINKTIQKIQGTQEEREQERTQDKQQEQEKAQYKQAMSTILEEKGFVFDNKERKLFNDTVARYESSGLSREDAELLATEELKESGYADKSAIGGADQRSISVPGKPIETDTGAIDTTGGDLAAAGTTTTDVGGGEGTELDTLAAELKAKYPQLTDEQALKNAEESLRQKKIADATKAGTDAVAYFEKKGALVSRMDELILENENLVQEQDDLRNKGIDEGDKYKYQDAIDAARKKYEENGAEFDSIYEQIQQLEVSPTTPTDTTAPSAPPVKTGKPRGRPAAAKTPEEQAKADAYKKQRQDIGRTAINDVTRAEKVLTQEVDTEQIINSATNEEDAISQLTQLKLQRIGALETAYRLSVDPDQKNKTAGKRASALLEGADPKELQTAKQIYESKKKIGAPSRAELTESTNGQDNTVFEKYNNVRSAVNWIANNGNPFEKLLAKRILPFLNKVKFVVVDSPDDMPTAFLRDRMEGAAGLYVPDRNTIYVMRNGGINNTVVLHEALHAATVARINAYLELREAGKPIPESLRPVAQLMAMMIRAKDNYDSLFSQSLESGDLGLLTPEMLEIPNEAFTDVKEFVAYGMSLPAMQEFLLLSPGKLAGAPPNFVDRLFNKFVQSIRQLFNMDEKHTSALQDLIIVTNKLLAAPIPKEAAISSEPVAAKKLNKKVAKVDTDIQKVTLSEDSTETQKLLGDATVEGHTFEYYKDLFESRTDAMGSGFIDKILGGMHGPDILRWAGDKIPALVEVNNLQNEMSAMRMRLLAEATKKTEKLAAFVRKNGQKQLGRAMHLARLKKVSADQFYTPSREDKSFDDIVKDDIVVKHYEKLMADPNISAKQKSAYQGQITKRTNGLKVVHDAWLALGKQKDGHAMYFMVRDYYKDTYNATRLLLDQQINALPIDPADKANLLKSVRLMHEKTKSPQKDPDDPDGFTDIAFPQLAEDYFPFRRYGDYWLRVNGGPTGREFYLFESATARNDFRDKRARALNVSKKDAKTFEKGNDIGALRTNFAENEVMLQNIFESVATFNFTPSATATTDEATLALKEKLKDQIYQIYLMTLPERSLRKQFLHAENITGFSSDVLRNFKSTATSYSNQLAKLKYGSDLRNEIQRARDSLTPEYRAPEKPLSPDERARLELFINEMNIRVEEELNPPEQSKLPDRINQFAFMMLLTSGASAITQMTSIPQMVMPNLNVDYGYLNAARAFMRYVNIFKGVNLPKRSEEGEISWEAPSISSYSAVKDNPLRSKAFQAAVDKNIFQLTNVSVLTDRAPTPMAVSGKPYDYRKTFYNMITALFNGSERISREMTYMMVFDLEYAKTKNFDASVQKAIDTTYELLGDYSNFARPRVLRNTVGKTVGQFKLYSLITSSFYLRNSFGIIRATQPEGKRLEAAHRVGGVMLMGVLLGGVKTVFLYTIICSVIDAYLSMNIFDNEEERRKRRARNPLTAESSDLRFRYDFLPKFFGNIPIPGIDGRDHRLSEVIENGPVSVLSDINFGSRVSHDVVGLWWRDGKPGKNAVETAQNIIIANLGPGVSTGINMVGGIEDLYDGKFDRGLEKLVPAFFKGSFVAERMRKEGAETKGGADLLKPAELNELNYISSVLGFQPTRLARIQDKNFKFNKEIIQATNKRSELLRSLNETIFDTEKKNKGEEIRKVIKEIVKHNKRYPAEVFAIEPDDIFRSIDSYAERRGMTIRGQYISEQLAPYLIKPTKAVTPLQ